MPIFDYKCSKCKFEYEAFFTSQNAVEKEEKKEKCPSCGSTRKRRQPPKGTSFELKGKWFKHGY